MQLHMPCALRLPSVVTRQQSLRATAKRAPTQYTSVDFQEKAVELYDLPCIDVSDVMEGACPSAELKVQVCLGAP